MIEPLRKPRPPTVEPVDGTPTAYIHEDVLEEIRFNGSWKANRVAGGLLVGSHYQCAETQARFVEIEGFISGTHCEDVRDFTRHLRLQWKAAGTSLRYHFPEAEVVGWYVAFPDAERARGQDALVLHNTFFNHAWQVGLWVPADGGDVAALTGRGDELVPGPVGRIQSR